MSEITQEQYESFLLQLSLMGITEEEAKLFAYPVVGNDGGVIAALKIDGWNYVAVKSGKFDGCSFRYGETITLEWGEGNTTKTPEWVECIVTIKGVENPVEVREYIYDNYREVVDSNGFVIATPWQSHTARCLRHKAQEQAYKTAFGLCGKAAEEAEAIAAASDAVATTPAPTPAPAAKPAAKAKAKAKPSKAMAAKAVAELAKEAEKFVSMAKATGGWQAAKSVITERYKGDKQKALLEALDKAQADANKTKKEAS